MATIPENQIIIEVDGDEEAAYQRARKMADDTFREVMAVRVFTQGKRQVIAGVLPIRVLLRILNYQAAVRGSTPNKAINATNRAVMNDHVKNIADYLRNALQNDEQYIIPPLTLNATRGMAVYKPRGMISGHAVLPEEQVLNITDGMHRFLAIQEVVNDLKGTNVGDKFMNDGIPVMITVESDVVQVHQDFADAGKTRPLPPSLMAVYDVRQPGNRAVHLIIEKVKLFNDRIDATSTTLSKTSPYLFLVNQVRQFVKSSLSGSPSLRDDAFTKQVQTVLANATAFATWVESRAIFLNVMTELIPDWKVIASLPLPSGPEGPKALAEMKKLREKAPVCLSAAFLNTLGMLSHTTLSDLGAFKPEELKTSLEEQLEPIRHINWARSQEFWNGNLVTRQGEPPKFSIKTQSPSIRAAREKLLELLT